MFELYYSNCPVPSAFVVAIRAFQDEFAARGVRFAVPPSEHSTTHFLRERLHRVGGTGQG